MKKTIYLPLVFALLFTTFSYASIRTDLQHYYNFTSDAKDSIGGVDGSVTSATFVSSAGILDGYYHFDGSDDVIVVDGISQLDENTGFTINFWVNGTGGAQSTDDLFGWGDEAGQNGIFPVGWGAANKIEYFLRDTGGTSRIANADTSNTYFSKGWTMFTMTFNKSAGTVYWKIFLNGTVADNTGSYTDQTFGFGNGAFGCLRRQNANVNYGLGDLDEIGIWNRTLNTLELESLYDMYITGTCNPVNNDTLCTGGAPPTPTLTVNSNLTNNTVNYNSRYLSFNYSGVTAYTSDTVYISFYVNGVHNETLQVDISEQNIFNITMPSNYENWLNISYNASNNNASYSSIIYFYDVDLVTPLLVTTNLINNSYHFEGTYSTFDVNFSDNNLFAFNITIENLNGDVLYNQFNNSLNGATEILRTITKNTTPIGNYTIKLYAWDSHTNNKVKDYLITELENGIMFDDVTIYGDINKITPYKKTDRYEFEIKFNKDSYTQNLTIYMKDLISLPNSKYKGHFLSLTEGKWLDFETPFIKNVFVEQEGNYAHITLEFYEKTKEVYFSSIGDLNEIKAFYYYQVQSEESYYLEQINNTLSNVYEVINILPIVALYGIFMWYRKELTRKRNYILAVSMGIVVFGFDLFFIQWIYDNHLSGNMGPTFQGLFIYLFAISLALWATTKLVSAFFENTRTKT